MLENKIKFMKTNNFSDTLVEEYDLFGKVFPSHGKLQQTISESLKSHFKESINGGSSLIFLDIGAGYGFTTKLVAKEFPKAKFILNEFDKELLSRADAYLESYNYEKKVGDIEEVIKTIPDESVDAVYTAWVLHNFPPVKRAVIYEQVSRILKPHGVFAVLEKLGNTGDQRIKDLAQILFDLSLFYTKHNRPDLFVEWTKHYLRDEEPNLVFTDDENEKLLKQNGFDWKYVKSILLDKVFFAIKK